MSTITVEQNRGKDSTIEIRQETRNTFTGPTNYLIFHSDQALDTDSNRAWNVNDAIKKYCWQRGFQLPRKPERKYQTAAHYDRAHHSMVLKFGIQQQIEDDDRYALASAQARKRAEELGEKYSLAIAQLKHAAFVLSQQLESELKLERKRLKKLESKIVNETKKPVAMLDADYERLLDPFHPLTRIEVRSKTTRELPDSFDAVLALLK